MALHFHRLAIKQIKAETADCISVCFDVPAHLEKAFAFTQGQNVNLRVQIGNEEVRRTYSICTAPHQNQLTVAIKKVPGGLFSQFAHQHFKTGMYVDVMEPSGKFNTPLYSAQSKRYMAFAAGSGITPIISIIKTTLHTEAGSQFTLLYGNQSPQSVIFLEELEALKNKYLHRFHLQYVFSRAQADVPVGSGRIDDDKLRLLNSISPLQAVDEFYICGPEAMIFCVKNCLTQLGIPKKNIHFELFASNSPTKSAGAIKEIDETTPGSHITIKVDGRNMQLQSKAGSTILDAALQAGADLPYACKGGVCCTCKAKLTTGQVKMDVHWGLEDDELAAGYILTCQARPISAQVSVDFDDR
jgi:ring-1,2-phenylacetyl-CoA epoxidase subunit PaaE